jgi:hypothetical protein
VCASGNNSAVGQLAPVEFDWYEDPKTAVHFAARTSRDPSEQVVQMTGTPEPYDPDRDDARDYYYLRWEMIDRGAGEIDPAELGDPEPPATRLTLHRTTCQK